MKPVGRKDSKSGDHKDVTATIRPPYIRMIIDIFAHPDSTWVGQMNLYDM
jgi:hypothetical protein